MKPPWNVPERIRAERLPERGDGRRLIAGGHPDNPLGAHRLELDRTLYRIHGTNTPWGVGRQVSHGCAQLHPGDMARLFPHVPLGTRVEFTCQPLAVGRCGDTAYVEVHRDLYRRGGATYAAARAAAKARGLRADAERQRAALRIPDGAAGTVDGPGTQRAARAGDGPAPQRAARACDGDS